jgi:hypothetical protein
MYVLNGLSLVMYCRALTRVQLQVSPIIQFLVLDRD